MLNIFPIFFASGPETLITAIPDLDDIDCNDDGADANLSFGSSKSITDYTNVGSSAGLGSAVNVNGLYETDSNSNNLRRSVFAFDTIIEGDLNEDVPADALAIERSDQKNIEGYSSKKRKKGKK